MQSQLQQFHDSKEVFREFRASKATSRGAADYRSDLNESLLDDLGRLGAKNSSEPQSSASRKRAWSQIAKPDVDRAVQVWIEDRSDFNFIKMHLMSHFVSAVRRFGNLKAWSTEIGEESHTEQLKEGWAMSNHINAYAQIIEHRIRKHQFRIRQLNLRRLKKDGDIFEDLGQTVPDLITGAERRVQNRRMRIGQSAPDVVLEQQDPLADFIPKNLLKSADKWMTLNEIQKEYKVPDLTWALQAYMRTLPVSSTFLVPNFHPDLLKDFRAQVYKKILIPVEDFQLQDQYTVHPVRSCLNWRGTGPRKDFIIFQKSEQDRYGDLHGKMVARLELLFVLQNPLSHTLFSLAFLTELKPYAGGTVQEPHGFVRFSKNREVDYAKENLQPFRRVIPIKKLLGIAHMIPYGINDYLLNAHIDLNTWNNSFDNNLNADIEDDGDSE